MPRSGRRSKRATTRSSASAVAASASASESDSMMQQSATTKDQPLPPSFNATNQINNNSMQQVQSVEGQLAVEMNESKSASASNVTMTDPVESTLPVSSSSSMSISPSVNQQQTISRYDNINHVQLSLFERWLHRDIDSPSIMLQMLTIPELQDFQFICKSTLRYLLATKRTVFEPNFRMGLFDVRKAGSIPGKAPIWVTLHVRKLGLFIRPLDGLQILTKFPNLIELELTIAVELTKNHHLLDVLTPLKYLQLLVLTIGLSLQRGVCGAEMDCDEQMNKKQRVALGKWSFAPLKQLKHLTHFQLETKGVRFYCEPHQVADLVQCQSLEKIMCGEWMGEHLLTTVERHKFVDNGIGKMHQLTKLQNLVLIQDSVDSRMWGHLCRIPSMKYLAPRTWSSDIEWKHLDNFTTLLKFSFTPINFREVKEPPAQMLPSLLKFTQLEDLYLGYVRLTKANLMDLMVTFNRLENLKLVKVRLESMQPFSKAANSLKNLTLCLVADFSNSYFAVSNMPPMPQLETFTVIEPSENWAIEFFKLGDRFANVWKAYEMKIQSLAPHATLDLSVQ